MSYPTTVKRWAISSINGALAFASASLKARTLNDQEMPSQVGVYVGVEPGSIANRQIAMGCDLRIVIVEATQTSCDAALDIVRAHFDFDPGAGGLQSSEAAAPSTKNLKLFDLKLAQEVPPEQQGPEGRWLAQRLYQTKGRDTGLGAPV